MSKEFPTCISNLMLKEFLDRYEIELLVALRKHEARFGIEPNNWTIESNVFTGNARNPNAQTIGIILKHD